jgi:hypothetical protein
LIEGEYRVVRDRWAPFKAWLYPKLVRLFLFMVTFVVGTAVLVTVRHFRG